MNTPHEVLHARALVIGSGLAGLNFALAFAEKNPAEKNPGGAPVVVVTKRAATMGSTSWAQGGLASVMSDEDSFEAHVQDTLIAGAGLCNEAVVRMCVEQGPHVVERLRSLGVAFDRAPAGTESQEMGDYVLGREGGHSQRRIVHAKDATGRAIEEACLTQTRQHEGEIRLLEQHMAIDLITSDRLGLSGERRVLGAYVLERSSGQVRLILSDVVVLASGGAGKVYLYTTNPDVSTGDGIAMAYRAGAAIANMEFMQFHPTCLYHPQAKSFLISEALRGEGGILKTQSGDAFMARYHPQQDLAPRDIVARAIDKEMKRSGDDHVCLDMRHHTRDYLSKRFPTIDERCLSLGIDMAQAPIPVVPAAHYMCGGVVTGLEGESDIAGLYAIGEAACTGLHGANRLASNSLLEAAVFSLRAARHAQAYLQKLTQPVAEIAARIPKWKEEQTLTSQEAVIITQNWDEIRRTMWNYVGIARSNQRLQRAQSRLKLIGEEIFDYYWKFKVTADLLELRNIAEVAHLIVHSAEQRHESRGLHYNEDYPQSQEEARHDTVLQRGITA